MSDADQLEPNQGAATGGESAGSGDDPPVSRFEVVPVAESNMGELYSYREAIASRTAELAPRQKNAPIPVAKILMMLVFVAGAVLLVLAVPSLFQSKPPIPYIDLGSQRFDPAGLTGRLIARWDNGSSYQLFLDPIDPQHAGSFAAVAEDPPRQLSIVLRFRDSDDRVACQKQILLPAPVASAPGADPVPQRGPQRTESGDTVENLTGENGQIAEINLTGPLPCPAKAYVTFKSWEFFTDFPTPGEQEVWLQHEKELNPKNRAGNARLSPPVQRLPIAIEGDDEIVGDNPSRDTVETSGGRVFFLGAAGMHNRTADWPMFPAPVHFHCDKNGSCTLTRPNSHVSLQARLLK
jgi:hypothetical protein